MTRAELARLYAERQRFIDGSRLAWAFSDAEKWCRCPEKSSSAASLEFRARIGSISKVFTVTLLGLLEEQGVVEFNETIGAYFPDLALSDTIASVTLRELATHRSGLPRLPANLRVDVPDPYALYGESDLRQFLETVSPGYLVDSRGMYQYSNVGFALLGRIMELASGDSYIQLLTELITTPLELPSVAIVTGDMIAAEIRDLWGMDADCEPQEPWRFDVFAPAGGLVATLNDLMRFGAELVCGQSEVARIGRKMAEWSGRSRSGVGFSWIHDDAIRWHNGATSGSHATMAINIDRKLVSVAAWNVNYSLDDIVLASVGSQVVPASLPREEEVCDTAVLQGYKGIYADHFGKYEIAISGSRLALESEHLGRVRLYKSGDHRFFAKKLPLEIIFDVDDHGKVQQIIAAVKGLPKIIGKPVR